MSKLEDALHALLPTYVDSCYVNHFEARAALAGVQARPWGGPRTAGRLAGGCAAGCIAGAARCAWDCLFDRPHPASILPLCPTPTPLPPHQGLDKKVNQHELQFGYFQRDLQYLMAQLSEARQSAAGAPAKVGARARRA